MECCWSRQLSIGFNPELEQLLSPDYVASLLIVLAGVHPHSGVRIEKIGKCITQKMGYHGIHERIRSITVGT